MFTMKVKILTSMIEVQKAIEELLDTTNLDFYVLDDDHKVLRVNVYKLTNDYGSTYYTSLDSSHVTHHEISELVDHVQYMIRY